MHDAAPSLQCGALSVLHVRGNRSHCDIGRGECEPSPFHFSSRRILDGMVFFSLRWCLLLMSRAAALLEREEKRTKERRFKNWYACMHYLCLWLSNLYIKTSNMAPPFCPFDRVCLTHYKAVTYIVLSSYSPSYKFASWLQRWKQEWRREGKVETYEYGYRFDPGKTIEPFQFTQRAPAQRLLRPGRRQHPLQRAKRVGSYPFRRERCQQLPLSLRPQSRLAFSWPRSRPGGRR